MRDKLNIAYLISPALLFAIIVSGYVLSRTGLLSHLDEKPNSDRAVFLDGARGLAASVVICSHAWRSEWFSLGVPGVGDRYWFALNLGSAGVQVFFALTAFLFVGRVIDLRGGLDTYSFIKSRVRRVVPLYLVWATFTLLVMLYFGKTIPLTLGSIAESFKIYLFGFYGNNVKIAGYDHPILTSVIWTLAYEIRFYCVIPLFAAMYTKKRSFELLLAFCLSQCC